MKDEVYSWRVSSELKEALEEAASAEGISVSRLLDRIVLDWLRQKKEDAAEVEQELRRIRERAMQYVGSVALGEGPYTAERVRERVRSRAKRADASTRSR